MLRPEARTTAVQLASRLIIKIAKQIADTGYRSGKLKLSGKFTDDADIELDHTIEKYIDAPERGILDSLVSYTREREKRAFIMLIDRSYSMRGLKIVLAAITAAAIAMRYRKDYAIFAFSRAVEPLKKIDEQICPEEVLYRLFNLELHGDTDIQKALHDGLTEVGKFERKSGLLLTDGGWNQGGDPADAAARFDRLDVIGFPPARQETIEYLAAKGKGACAYAEDQTDIAAAIIKCLH